MILVNFSNQLGAGPKNISINFIKQVIQQKIEDDFFFIIPSIEGFLDFNDADKINIKYVEKGQGVIHTILKTINLNLIEIPKICRDKGVTSVLAFGNFLLSPLKGMRKVVLLHHPYLVDDVMFRELSIMMKLHETIKRIAFFFTVLNVDKVVVQSEYMRRAFIEKYPAYAHKLEIIFNPISDVFSQVRSKENAQINLMSLVRKKECILFYVSRFYPHKNHEFLISLAKYIIEKKFPIRIIVTIDENLPGAKYFLTKVMKYKLPIENLGEINQSELIDHYRYCDMVIFPSKTETFGNPLIEAMFFSLPVICPDKEYAHAILGEACTYYKENSPTECFDLVRELIEDKTKYLEVANYFFERSKLFPNSELWLSQYLSLVSQRLIKQ